jgi:two-component system phosphate regulon sensor histidine kinase PhoR
LIVNERNGILTTEFNATKYNFRIDEFHFSNALINLLDNANKYSPETPEIKLTTRNEGNWYVVKFRTKEWEWSRPTKQKSLKNSSGRNRKHP